MRAATGILAIALVALVPRPAHAIFDLVDSDTFHWTVGGTVRSLSGMSHASLDPGDAFDRDTGLNSTIVRVEWNATIGERLTLELHDRLFWSLSSQDTLLASGVGAGVSTAPDSHVDTTTTLVDGDNFALQHDLDRYVVRLYLDDADIWIGRQAITWGTSLLFPVADLWTTFSPFELDTSEKRGILAARAITAISPSVELDFIVADRGEWEDTSGGVRANVFLANGDAYFAFAKNWEELMLFAGYAHYFDQWSLRFEANQPFDLDDSELLLPRATIGLERYWNDVLLAIELHYAGLGTDEPDDYATHLVQQEEPYGRGEAYLWGRYYAGAMISWQVFKLLTFNSVVMGNLRDPSAIISPSLTYNVAQDVDLTMGTYNGIGARPSLEGFLPTIDSEFGSYGDFYYVQFAAYY